MRVGIVTITELSNFGNRLQNYALQTTLEKLGCEVETIPNYIIYGHLRKPIPKLKRRIKGFLKILLRRDYLDIAESKKMKRFDAFDAEYIHKASDCQSTIDTITPGLNEKYDRFIAGSDQIWNPHFTFNFDFEFLRFADKYKRIAYSASFGVAEIPQNKETYFRTALQEMYAISVREYAGKKIVAQLTGRDVPVLPDPTLLLDKQDWEKLEKKPEWIREGKQYLLSYFLGSTEERAAIMHQICAEKEVYKTFELIDIYNPTDLKRFSIGPCEFIWLIHHAEVMITDSFHGTVFSILMGTPFISVKRQDNFVSMNSRIESLFHLLGLSVHEGIVTEHIEKQKQLEDILQQHKVEAWQYLRQSLDIC